MSSQNVQSGCLNPEVARRSVYRSKGKLDGYLLTFELSPPFVVKLQVEISQVACVYEVYEPVPHVTVVLRLTKMYLKVTWQVKEIVCVSKVVIDFLAQVFDSVLIGDVTDHDRRSRIVANRIHHDFKDVAIVAGRHLICLVNKVLHVVLNGVVVERLLVIHRTRITFLN